MSNCLKLRLKLEAPELCLKLRLKLEAPKLRLAWAHTTRRTRAASKLMAGKRAISRGSNAMAPRLILERFERREGRGTLVKEAW